jgi:hypothetical protein
MANELIRLLYEIVTDKSACLAKPVLRVLSPPHNMFAATHFFLEYNHEWLDPENLTPKKLKNSDCLWRHALISTRASIYKKSNGVCIGSINYILTN